MTHNRNDLLLCTQHFRSAVTLFESKLENYILSPDDCLERTKKYKMDEKGEVGAIYNLNIIHIRRWWIQINRSLGSVESRLHAAKRFLCIA